jgi:homocitrate synthase NifV
VEKDLPLEIHAHNDLGMATANTLAAYLAGATCLSTTINGLGERAGNAAMEEVAMALELSLGISSGLRTESFSALSKYVAGVSNRPLSVSKPVTGSMVLSHESGIHTRCLMKDRSTYQIIQAASIGLEEQDFILGKHSGKSTILHFLEEAHLPITDDACSELLTNVKDTAEELKRTLSKEELYTLYTSICAKKNHTLLKYK